MTLIERRLLIFFYKEEGRKCRKHTNEKNYKVTQRECTDCRRRISRISSDIRAPLDAPLYICIYAVGR